MARSPTLDTGHCLHKPIGMYKYAISWQIYRCAAFVSIDTNFYIKTCQAIASTEHCFHNGKMISRNRSMNSSKRRKNTNEQLSSIPHCDKYISFWMLRLRLETNFSLLLLHFCRMFWTLIDFCISFYSCREWNKTFLNIVENKMQCETLDSGDWVKTATRTT